MVETPTLGKNERIRAASETEELSGPGLLGDVGIVATPSVTGIKLSSGGHVSPAAEAQQRSAINENWRFLWAGAAFLLRPLTCGSAWEMVRRRIDLEYSSLACHPELAPPLVAQQLLVSGEDHRHAWHPGFDVIAICRAVWRNLAHGAREGGSTIEQQVVRTITGRYERTLRRKLKEILLAILVAASFPKSVPPVVYLSIAYYGWRMNGYHQACRRLGLRPGSLTMAEAASLVARLKYPEPSSAPSSRSFQIRRRSMHLLNLYRRHLLDGTYEHLNATTIYSRSIALEPAESVPEP